MPRLFSYGTLQLRDVQLATFGRELAGVSDRLTGYRIDTIEIDDPTVVALSGKATHLVLRPTGEAADVVDGTIYELSEAELAAADDYETADYARVTATSASGVNTFVYVLAADVTVAPPLQGRDWGAASPPAPSSRPKPRPDPLP